MLTTDERMAKLIWRIGVQRQKNEKRSLATLSTVCAMLCMGLLCLTRAYGGMESHRVNIAELCGSTLLFENAGGYVIVGVTAFVAAVIITVICMRHKEKTNKQTIEEKKEDVK